MKYALIGCGRISPNHIVAAQKNGLEIVAICDLEMRNMKDKFLKFRLSDTVQCYTDYRLMLEKEKPDLIAIATESGKHAQIALDCMTIGHANLIIEKPIALSLADADAIIETARRENLKVCACHQNRFNKSIQKIREAVEMERFGRMFHGTAHIRWARDYEYYSRAKWRGTWEQDGGALMNQCIHGIDLLRWMMGDEIEEVYGVARQQFHSYLEAEDVGMAVVKFKNGAVATIEGTTNVYPKNLEETLYLFGENGTVKLGGKSTNTIDVWEFADAKEADDANKGFQEAAANVYGNGHARLFADMVAAIREDRKPYVDAYAGRRALELVLAVYKSQKTGKAVKFPVGQFAASDMEGYFNG